MDRLDALQWLRLHDIMSLKICWSVILFWIFDSRFGFDHYEARRDETAGNISTSNFTWMTMCVNQLCVGSHCPQRCSSGWLCCTVLICMRVPHDRNEYVQCPALVLCLCECRPDACHLYWACHNQSRCSYRKSIIEKCSSYYSYFFSFASSVLSSAANSQSSWDYARSM